MKEHFYLKVIYQAPFFCRQSNGYRITG